MQHYQQIFNKVGWFIPPFVPMGILQEILIKVDKLDSKDKQPTLETLLSAIYTPESLAPLVTERYPIIPGIQDFKEIIAESIEAHFWGLDHIAVSSLIPVVEGAGKMIAGRKPNAGAKDVFKRLITECKDKVQQKNIGDVNETLSMLESFKTFIDNHFYIDSQKYDLSDKTNRHGILHGSFSDEDYGQPINFYKTITAINFLSFISAINGAGSYFPPKPTAASNDACDLLPAMPKPCNKQANSL